MRGTARGPGRRAVRSGRGTGTRGVRAYGWRARATRARLAPGRGWEVLRGSGSRGLLVLGAAGWWAAGGGRDAWTGAVFSAVVVLGEVLRVGGEGAPLSTAGVLGYALLGQPGGAAVVRAVCLALAATAAGRLLRRAVPLLAPLLMSLRAPLLGPPPHRTPSRTTPASPERPHSHAARTRGRRPRARAARSGRHASGEARRESGGTGAARRATAVAVAAVCCQPLGTGGELTGAARAAHLAGVLAVTAGWDVALAAAPAVRRGGPALAAALRDAARTRARTAPATAAGCLVLALAATAAGPWAVPPAAVPLLLAQLSLRGHAAVRATYRATVASLARATEVAGYTPPGHARRVSELAAALGRELGLTAPDLRDLEHAALMHDIGQLSLVDPLPYGATEPLDDARRRAVAALGGEVVRSTGAPPGVALVVERQAHPYREQPLAGRIVRVANAYEDFTGAAAGASQPPAARLAAVERIRLATARDYDPRVVAALSRVLARQPGRAWLDAVADGKEDG